MHTQYPPVQDSEENFASVHAWLLQISNKGYSDHEVEEMIGHITKLSEANKLAEAAQLLLITGATQSKFAQFMLARALYKGVILQKNLPEAFTLINRLAMDDNYPEAICDLAQFYEYGIGIDRDKNKAEILYEEAMNLGIQRATAHYERVKKQNKGFFAAFKK
jgi:TPR repeat protein